MVVRQEALLNAAEDADRTDRVFIGRVNVVHVIPYLRDDLAEIAHELSEDTSLVETSQVVSGSSPMSGCA